MNKVTLLLLFLTFGLSAQKTRILVTTDLGQDPDDQQSLIRLLHYTDLLEIEGLILNADSNNNYEAPLLSTILADTILSAYTNTYSSLIRYGDFTEPSIIKSKLKKGSTSNSIHKPIDSYLGAYFETEGSAWIIKKVDESTSKKPLHVCLWGGGVDLAQALWSVKKNRSVAELKSFVSKIKVYSIAKQDTAIDWMIQNFPDLYFILSHHPDSSWKASFRGMFLGGDLQNTSQAFFDKYIISENPLTELYPSNTYTGSNPHNFMKEGDSPSFLFFIKSGLNDSFQPSLGSWGGRFKSTNNYLWTDTKDSLNSSTIDAISTVSRWRSAFQADFIMKAQWGNPKNSSVNLPPVVVASVQEVETIKGRRYNLDASHSFDPNDDELKLHWWVYKEPSSFKGSILIDKPVSPKTHLTISEIGSSFVDIQLLLEVSDKYGVTRYKRFILKAGK